MIGTTYNNNANNSDSSAIDYIFTQRLMQINTCLPCKVLAVNGKTCDIISLLNYVDANGNPTAPPIQYNVPILDIVGDNCGVEIEYAIGDVVAVLYIQRDLTNLETIWATGADPTNQVNPNSSRQFSLSDGIILGRISPKIPEVKIKITKAGILIEAKDKPITLNSTGNIVANCKDANITATGNIVANCVQANVTATGSTTITSPTITLAGNVVISGTMQCASANVTGALACSGASIGGKEYTAHVHSGVQTGTSNTGGVV